MAFLPIEQENSLLDALAQQRQSIAQGQSQITAGQVQNISAIRQNNPWMTPGTTAALGLSGYGPDHPVTQAAAQGEFKTQAQTTQSFKVGDKVFTNEAAAKNYAGGLKAVAGFKASGGAFSDVTGTIGDVAHLLTRTHPGEGSVPGLGQAQQVVKGVTRAAGVALETPLQALVGTVRAGAGNEFQPYNPVQQLSEGAQQTSGYQAVKDVVQGQQVDLGTGFLPSSTSGVEQAQAAAARKFSPFLIGGHAWTPGRFLASQVFEPDSTAYNVASGVVDAGVAMSNIDPAAAVLTNMAEARQAGKVFSAAPDVAGAMQGVRKFKNTLTGDAYLNVSPQGAAAVAGITNTQDPYVIYKALSKKGEEFPIVTQDWKPGDQPFIGQLAKSNTPEDTKALLQPHLGTDVSYVPTWTPKAATGGAAVQPRWLGTVPGRTVDFNDPNGAWKTLESHMDNAKVPLGVQHDVFNTFVEGIGTKPGNYASLDATFSAVEHSLVAHGMDPARARNMTTIFRNRWQDTNLYNIDDIGNNVANPVHVVAGDAQPTNSPHLLSEMMGNKIDLPVNYRDVKLGTANPLVKTFLDNGPVHGLTDALDAGLSFWRDLHILRPAITVRAVGTGQLEMAGTGASSLAFHPFNAIATIIGANPEGSFYRHVQSAADKIEEFLPSALTRHLNPPAQLSTSLAGAPFTSYPEIAQDLAKPYQAYNPQKLFLDQWARVDKSHPQYAKGWATEIGQLASDPVASNITRMEPNAAKDWFFSGQGAQYRHELAQDPQYAEMGADTGAAKIESDKYIDSVFQRIQVKSSNGDPRLLDAIKTGRVNDIPITDWAWLSRDEGADSQSIERQFKALQDEGLGPDVVKTPRFVTLSAEAKARTSARLTAAEQHAYSALLTRPTNYLMRDPFFRQKYWDHAETLFPSMTPEARATMLDRIDTANLPAGREAALRGVDQQLGTKGGALELDGADTLARKAALQDHRDYLHNLYDKSQVFDSLRFLFPFGDAWQKMISRWSKIAIENPQVLRRTQQVVEGAQGSGFFHKDPTSGQEVFTYPGSGLLTDKLLGVPVPLQGSVNGLSLVGEGTPGIGPALTLPASYLLPDKPSTDWIKGLVFPFGDKSTGNPLQDVTNELTPAWLQKLTTAAFANPNSDRLYANTVFDVAKSLESTGQYDLHGPDATAEYNRLLADAKDKARWLYVIRGVAQSAVPSAPTPQFQAKDKSGNWTQIGIMANEYNKTLAKTHDTSAALKDLMDRYGTDNFLVAQPKSKPLIPGLPSSSQGLDFQRANPDLVKSYPNVWGLFAPTGGTFDQAAYDQQFGRGERQALTPEQMVRFANARLATQQYYHAADQFGSSPTTGQRQYLTDLKAYLTQHYPGYGDQQPSFKQTPALVGELQNAATDPKVLATDAGKGLKLYLDARAQAQKVAENAGLKSPFSAKSMAGQRAWLRDYAAWVESQHPDFTTMWDQVFSRELKTDLAPAKAGA